MKTYTLIVTGRVQGVGYRSYVCSTALSMGINGFVRNLEDGTVEIVAQHDDHNIIEKFIENAKKAPYPMKVENVNRGIVEMKAFDGFTIQI